MRLKIFFVGASTNWRVNVRPQNEAVYACIQESFPFMDWSMSMIFEVFIVLSFLVVMLLEPQSARIRVLFLAFLPFVHKPVPTD